MYVANIRILVCVIGIRSIFEWIADVERFKATCSLFFLFRQQKILSANESICVISVEELENETTVCLLLSRRKKNIVKRSSILSNLGLFFLLLFSRLRSIRTRFSTIWMWRNLKYLYQNLLPLTTPIDDC